MSLDELLGFLFMLYILGSVISALLRREGRRGTAPGQDEGELSDWEKELEELFRRHREAEPSPEEGAPSDDRPWLEVEPIPPLEGPEVPLPRRDREGAGQDLPTAGLPAEPAEAPGEPWPEESPALPRPAEERLGWEPVGQKPRQEGVEVREPRERVMPAPSARSQPAESVEPEETPRPLLRSSGASPPAASRSQERQPIPAAVAHAPWQRIRGAAGSWREAIILREILDEPRALRPYRPPRGFWWSRVRS